MSNTNHPHPVPSLAQRAKLGSHLKDLMQGVSTGNASKAQFTEFQTYIDDMQKNANSPAIHPASIPPPDLPSRLLSVPKEIRLEIYRYLLLPTEFVSIEPGHPKDGRRHRDDDTLSNDSWTDEDSILFDGDNSDMEIEYNGPDLGSLFWSMVQQQEPGQPSEVDPEFPFNSEAESILNEAVQTASAPNITELVNLEDGGTAGRTRIREEWETTSDDDMEEYRMFPEILRVNKQIHEEASSVLFTEGTVVINANDMFFLTAKNLKYGTKYGDTPWKHNPLTSVWKRLPGGTIEYNTGDLGGWMEPHIFAKFQKVLFDCTLEEEHTENLSFFLDVDTWKLNHEEATKFAQYIRTLTFIKDFVKLLSKSQLINKLSINVLVEINANTRLDSESIDSNDDDAFDEMDHKQDKADMEANSRATEIFMDANMFLPLKRLQNVRRLSFGYGFEDYIPPIDYIPAQKYKDMVKHLKRLVEGNFKEPEEPTRGGLRSQGSVAAESL
ncbi:hypothetical protein DSL72_003773 [Monilinia vaccinii-corymbosi]|uniref:F-box domain-containing protein n=1 Tax=Monilinia vaccinii-corymbosi TaxID=61207 RepID=A0A8A3P367_9HELO|nr:hypothetical protein DSL72_003773 [Monilinia vaccinii-corymbosi]